jgi:hypothetical protein
MVITISLLRNKRETFRDIGFSDFIHRPGIKKQTKETRRFGNWICFRPQKTVLAYYIDTGGF